MSLSFRLAAAVVHACFMCSMTLWHEHCGIVQENDADRSWMYAAYADWVPKQRRWRETQVWHFFHSLQPLCQLHKFETVALPGTHHPSNRIPAVSQHPEIMFLSCAIECHVRLSYSICVSSTAPFWPRHGQPSPFALHTRSAFVAPCLYSCT